MNREIKFRAWDGYKIDNNPVAWTNSDPFTELNPLFRTDDKKIIFMQFTSLKDKNGKEIYEGDIVKYRIYDESGTDEVEFRYANFILKNDYSSLSMLSELEVIGNIYENNNLISPTEKR